MTDVMVKLGEHELAVPEQRIGRLENRGRSLFLSLATVDVQELMAGDNVGAAVLALGRERAYDLLCIVVPQVSKRMPRWEFAGYASAEAMAAGEYDDDADKSPTWPEIINAFETAKRVNHFDFIDGIKKLAKGLYEKVDPTLVGQWVNLLAAEMATALPTSLSSPAPTDGVEAFYDERPNYTCARGVTIPRLEGLVTAYAARRNRELQVLGRVVNLAVVDPDKLADLTKPAAVAGDATNDVEYVERYWD